MLNKNIFISFLLLSAAGIMLFLIAPVFELLHNIPIKQEAGAWLMPLIWLAVCGMLYLIVIKVFFKVFPASIAQNEAGTIDKDTPIFVLMGHILLIFEPVLGVFFAAWNLARIVGLK
jgi:type VI protein secretion system component VasK